ncbi:MAG: transcription elongation factor GreA [Mycoplasmataceae bacterium]|nr:transcription elongation factor GreA [Mycoplasmataceae bacterium]
MEIEKHIISKEGRKELQLEIKELVEVARPKVIQEIKDARALGDLSENAEFDAAREMQGKIEDRITEIEVILSSAQLISTNTKAAKAGKVFIGSTVTYQEVSTKEKFSVTIVGSLEVDPFESKISNTSPLGATLLDLSVNEIGTVIVENKYDVKVIKVV